MLHKQKSLYALLAIGLLFFTACKKDEEKKEPLSIPANYISTAYETNAAEELSLRNNFKAFVDAIKQGNDVANKLDKATLQGLFEAGNPSVSALTAAYYRSKIGVQWLDDLATASQNTFDPFNLNGTGGVYGGNRLLDARGVETLQLVEKGLFASLFYRRLLEIMYGNLSEGDVDRLVCLIGAHPEFPNTYLTSNTSNPDINLANYIARRDKADGTGFYTGMKKAFIKLKAAVRAGAEYNTERQEARDAIRDNIEKGLMATAVNYSYSAIAKLSATNPDEAALSGGLHDLSEAAGFIHGLLGIEASLRKVSDAQINQMLELLRTPAAGEASLYLFATQPSSELQRLVDLIALIKSVYGFSDAQLEDFKQNWVTVQGR
jgi:hypothetical protein